MIDEDISVDDDLQSAVKEALERKGVIKDVKARLRASVFSCLEDKTVQLPEKKSKDLYLASELIRDFLISLNLGSTLSVFCEELGQPSEILCDREFIAGELGFSLSSRDKDHNKDSIPLIVQLVEQLRLNKDRYHPNSSLAVHDDV